MNERVIVALLTINRTKALWIVFVNLKKKKRTKRELFYRSDVETRQNRVDTNRLSLIDVRRVNFTVKVSRKSTRRVTR